MLKITDQRGNDGKVLLKNMDCDGFFELEGDIYRRVRWYSEEMSINPVDDNSYVCIDMENGILYPIDMEEEVKPIGDDRLELLLI